MKKKIIIKNKEEILRDIKNLNNLSLKLTRSNSISTNDSNDDDDKVNKTIETKLLLKLENKEELKDDFNNLITGFLPTKLTEND